MDSYQNSKSMPTQASMSCTQIEFSSHHFNHLSQSMGAKKPRWISPSPKKTTMTQIRSSKNIEVRNSRSRTTKSFESNFMKRKSSLSNAIDNKIKRMEALHEETTTTISDSDTTITKIDCSSKRRKLSKTDEEFSEFENLCKPLKDVENTVRQSSLLQPFNREEDIKIIMHFHKYMELLSRKDDLYTYQLLEMKYRFQRSAKFLRDRFLTEILPNLYVYDCLTLDEMVIFYDKADMLVPKHVQNMIRDKFRRTTGHDIRSPETDVITITDSENEETDTAKNDNVTAPVSSSSIIRKRRNKVLKLPSPVSSENSSGKTLDSCNNTKVPCVVSSVSKELSSINNSNVCDSAGHKSIETCQLVEYSDQSKRISVEQKICDTNVVEDNNKEHSYKELENITSTCDTEEKNADSVPLSPCLFESSDEEKTTCDKEPDSISSSAKHNTNCATECNKQNGEHEKQVSTKISDNCNSNKEAEPSQTLQNDLSQESDHTYVKVNNATDSSPDDVNSQQESDNSQSSTFSAKTVLLAEKCSSTDIENIKYFAKATQTNSSEQLVTCISDKSFKDEGTSTEFTKNAKATQTNNSEPAVKTLSDKTYEHASTNTEFIKNAKATQTNSSEVFISDKSFKDESTSTEFTKNAKATQTDNSEPAVKSISDKSFKDESRNTEFRKNARIPLTTLGLNNLDRILCTELDVIELIMNGVMHIFISKDVDDCNVKEITGKYDTSKNFVDFIDKKTFECLKVATEYRNYIDAVILRMVEKEIKAGNALKNSGYNLRRFVKNPHSGTMSGRKIQWYKNRKDRGVKRKTETETDSQCASVSGNLTPARRTQQIRKLFGVPRRNKYRKSKSRKQIKKASVLSPASEERNESSATSTPDSYTTTVKENKISESDNQVSQSTLESDNQISKSTSESGNQIRTSTSKSNNQISKSSESNNQISKSSESGNQCSKSSESDNQISKSTSESNNQISKSSPETEEPTQSVTSETSTSSVSNKPVPPSSNQPTVAEINKNTTNALPISDPKKENPERKCNKPDSNNQINKTTPSKTKPSNQSTSTSVEVNPTKMIANIKNNFEKRVYKQLERFYRCRVTEESNQPAASIQCRSSVSEESSNQSAASSTPDTNRQVYVKINKTTGNVLEIWPVRKSIDKEIISTDLNTTISDSNNTVNTHMNEQVSEKMETSKATSVTENTNVQQTSESTDLNNTVSDSNNTVNTHMNEQVSEKMETSKATSVTENTNVQQTSESTDLNTTISDSSNTVNTHMNEQVSKKIETSKATSVTENVQEKSESTDLNTTASDSSSTVNTDMNEEVSEKMISSSESRVSDVPSDQDSNSSSDETPPAKKMKRIWRKEPVQHDHKQELSLIKPKRTYTRKASTEKLPDSSTSAVDSLPQISPELPDSMDDSGLEMIASQLDLESPITNTSCSTQISSSASSDDVILIEDEPNCILDFLIDDIKKEKEDTPEDVPANIPDPIYETVSVNRDDVNVTTNSSSPTSSEPDSVWGTIKRIMYSVVDDNERCRVLVKSKNTQTDNNISSTTQLNNEHNYVQVKQELIKEELITTDGVIKQECITEKDSWENYPEMSFDCAQIKQEISILEGNTVTSRYFSSDNFDPILPVNLPNESVSTCLNMSKKLRALVTEKRLSINHLKPVSETEIKPEQTMKTENE